MNTHRPTIVVTTIVCVVSIVTSLLLTINSVRFLTNWFTYILSVVVGVFTSALIILISSIINLNVRKREVASSYMLPMSQLNIEIDLLRLFFVKYHITLDSTLSYHEEFSKLEVVFSQLAEKYTTLLLIERMSWVSQKHYDQFASILSKNRLPYIENTFKKLSAQAASCTTVVLALLKRYAFHDDNGKTTDLFSVFRDQMTVLNELIRPDGEYAECMTKFEKIRCRILNLPNSD